DLPPGPAALRLPGAAWLENVVAEPGDPGLQPLCSSGCPLRHYPLRSSTNFVGRREPVGGWTPLVGGCHRHRRRRLLGAHLFSDGQSTLAVSADAISLLGDHAAPGYGGDAGRFHL